MHHENPLLRGQSKDHRFITMGEIMLRLTPPNYDKIRVANSFEISYGGSEANIALALANLGTDATFFSVVVEYIEQGLFVVSALHGLGQPHHPSAGSLAATCFDGMSI